VCLVKPRDQLLLPCLHFAMCRACALQQGTGLNRKCPVCRASYDRRIPLPAASLLRKCRFPLCPNMARVLNNPSDEECRHVVYCKTHDDARVFFGSKTCVECRERLGNSVDDGTLEVKERCTVIVS
jgi:hypothetical protein